MRTTALLLCYVLAIGAKAQLLDQLGLDTVRTFHSLEQALKQPDRVYHLDLTREKLREVPEDVRRFTNLNILVLDRNKLKELPAWLAELPHLQELRLHRNRFGTFPEVICRLPHLKRLDLSRNALDGLPDCIGGLQELVSLDLWSNDIASLPDDIADLRALRFLDMRVIQLEEGEIERIRELVPWAETYFSPPCNCGM